MLKLPENGHKKRAKLKPVLQKIRSQQLNLLQDRFVSWVLKLSTSLSNSFCRILHNKLHVLVARFFVFFFCSLGLGQTSTFSWDEPNSSLGQPKLSSVGPEVELRTLRTNQLTMAWYECDFTIFHWWRNFFLTESWLNGKTDFLISKWKLC